MSNISDKVMNLLKSACQFQGKSMESRQLASAKYKEKESAAENTLRVIIDGLMVKLTENMQNKVKDSNEKISYQISLSASYVRTHFIINDLILNGDLIEALILVRKQLEALTRLREIDAKPLQKLIGRTPNVMNIFYNAGKSVYPDLSEIAHSSGRRVGELLHILENEEFVGPSLIPRYTETSHHCFSFQTLVSIYFLDWFIGKQKEFYDWFNGEEEYDIFLKGLEIAVESGIIQVKKEKA